MLDPPARKRALRVFGERLRKERKQRRLTQRQLAVLVGMPRSQISHFERGARDPSILSARSLARGLGISLSELLMGLGLGLP